MLQDRDLHTYLELFRLASEAKHFPTPASLDEVLRSDNGSIHHLRREHLTPLWNSLKIAWAADGAPELAFHVIHRVVNELTDDASYVPFTSQDAWISAIRWALAAIEDSGSGAPSLQQSDRRSTVGLAVQRLRNCGYSIAIGAHGPILNTETKRAIAARIHSLISSLGGIQVARQICYYMRLKHKVHDGMWALGHRVSYSHPAEPAAPIAWLFSIAIRYFHVIPSSLNRASDWKTAVSLAVDFAACIDCQRYNQFEMLNLEPSDYVPTLMELLEWRELFWLPQVPPATLATLSTALSCVGWPEKPKDLRRTVQGLFCEMDHLLGVLADDNLTMIPTVDARARYPLLWSHARAAPGKANSRYMGPFDSEERCHDRFLMFETTGSSGNRVDRGVSGRHRRGRDQDRRGESRWRCGSACGYESRALSISASARPR